MTPWQWVVKTDTWQRDNEIIQYQKSQLFSSLLIRSSEWEVVRMRPAAALSSLTSFRVLLDSG